MKIQRLFLILLATSFLFVGCGGPSAESKNLTAKQVLFDKYAAALVAADVPALMALYDTNYLKSGLDKATEEADLNTFFNGGGTYTAATYTVSNQATYGGMEIVEVTMNLTDSTGPVYVDRKRFFYLIQTGGIWFLYGDQWDGVAANCSFTGITAISSVSLSPGYAPAAGTTISRAAGVTFSMSYDYNFTSDNPASIYVTVHWVQTGVAGGKTDVLDRVKLIQPEGGAVNATPPAANLTLAAPTVNYLGEALTPDTAFLTITGYSDICGGINPMNSVTYTVGP